MVYGGMHLPSMEKARLGRSFSYPAILVRSSLKSIGFVSGEAETVVSALLEVLGREGALVVPAFSCGTWLTRLP